MSLNVLPLPGEDLRDWANQLVAALEGSDLSGLNLPILDSAGRIIVDSGGVTVFDPGTGDAIITPQIVQIDKQHLVDAAITTNKLANAAVDVDKLADLAVTASKLGTGAVDLQSNRITGLLQSANLADAAVNQQKLADLAVIASKLDDDAVEERAIANLAVGRAAIQLLAVGEAQLGDASISEAKIQELAVGQAAIQAAAIGTAQIANGVIINAHIGDAEISNAKIESLAANKITAGAIGAHRITIPDEQAVPVVRLEFGKLGAGVADYGLIVRDASGQTMISAVDRSFDSSLVDALLAVNGPAEAGADVTSIRFGSLLLNGGFETGTAEGWVLGSAGTAIVNDPANAYSGTFVLRQEEALVAPNTLSDPIPASQGDRFLIEARLKRDESSLPEKVAGIGWREYNSALTQGSIRVQQDAADEAVSGYQRVRAVVDIVDADTAFFRIDLNTNDPVGSGGHWFFDQVRYAPLPRDADIDALLTTNGPAEAGAEQTTGKSITLLADRIASNIAETGTLKWAGESGADVTAGKSLTVLIDREADNIAESVGRKWAAESGADITSGHKALSIETPDTRNADELPSFYRALGRGLYPEFKETATLGIGSGTHGFLVTQVKWGDTSGGRITQEFYDDADVKYRRLGAADDLSWGPWNKSFDEAAKPDLGSDILNNIADNVSETAGRKWAAESGADVTAGKSLTSLVDVIADNIAEGLTRKWAGESGADITASHQGDVFLANLGEKDMASLTNRIADLVAETTTRKWAGESGADVTGNNTALDIVGQGNFATVSQITGLNIPTLIAQAAIADTYISDLSADKITAGTIDAALVNVINLNADNITAGTINAATINVINLNADEINAGTLNASVVSVTNLDASNITAGTLTGRTIQTADPTGNPKRFVVSAANNEAEFYGDRGDGTVTLLASIGINTIGSDVFIARFGDSNSNRVAINAAANRNGPVATIVNSGSGNAISFSTAADKGILLIAGASVGRLFSKNDELYWDTNNSGNSALYEAITGTTKSLATNGYVKMPSGLIIQWGRTGTIGPNASVTVVLPTAFSLSTSYKVTTTQFTSSTAIVDSCNAHSQLAGQFQVVNSDDSGSRICNWIAVGY